VLPVLAPISGAASGLVGAIFRLTLEEADRSSSPQSCLGFEPRRDYRIAGLRPCRCRHAYPGHEWILTGLGRIAAAALVSAAPDQAARGSAVRGSAPAFADLRIGFPVELMPAGGSTPIDGRIDEILPRGEFVTWRAARAVGDDDLNTFVLRADPVGPASEALQPGMSVWLKPARNTALR